MQYERNNGSVARVVLDTNTVVSGFLWRGSPYRILEIERAGHIRLFTNEPLLAELARVVSRSKFFVQFKRVGTSADLLLSAYRKSAVVVEPAAIKPTVRADPTDDAVLACAKAADANFIVSGDDHLLSLREFDGIRIHDAAELVALFP